MLKEMDYQKQGRDFLQKYNITMKVVFKGDKCPMWDDDKHMHGDRHLIIFKREGRRFSISFWNSIKDSEEGNIPTAYDVLTCLTKNDPEGFTEFCSNFGYEEDSRKAFQTYKAVIKEWLKVSTFFTEEEIEELQEIN